LSLKDQATQREQVVQVLRSSASKEFTHQSAQLGTVVKRVQLNAESVATASDAIAQLSHDLSTRAEQQVSPLEQASAAMEQLG
jgi:methyl-accepting chemotaxis protein